MTVKSNIEEESTVEPETQDTVIPENQDPPNTNSLHLSEAPVLSAIPSNHLNSNALPSITPAMTPRTGTHHHPIQSVPLTPVQEARVRELGKAMDNIQASMAENRRVNNRPESLESMSLAQLKEEKSQLQHLLLQFEEEFRR